MGDEETISVKSSDNTIQFNTFKRNFRDHSNRKQRRYGQVNLRHGNRNSIVGNTLIDMGLINIRGDDHRVLGNRMVTRNSKSNRRLSNIRVCKGNVSNALGSWRLGKNPDGKHPCARRCVVAGNDIDGNLELGRSGGTGSSGGNQPNLPAEDTIYQKNEIRGEIDRDKQKGSKKSGFRGSIPKTVEMTPAKVGVNAPDPREKTPGGDPGGHPPDRGPDPSEGGITQTLRDGDRIDPGEFEWRATVKADDGGAVLFLVDGEEVNRETSAPYGDRRNNHENFFQWRDTTRYGAGKHKMTVRIASTGEENSVTVDMTVPGVDPNAPITQTL